MVGVFDASPFNESAMSAGPLLPVLEEAEESDVPGLDRSGISVDMCASRVIFTL